MATRPVPRNFEDLRTVPLTREPDAGRPYARLDALPRTRSTNLERLVNITLASIGLLLAAPIMLVFAILIKLTSPGPIFYRQARVGLDRRRRREPGSSYDRRTRDLGGKPFMI